MVQSTRPRSDIMFEDLARLVKQEEEVAIQVSRDRAHVRFSSPPFCIRPISPTLQFGNRIIEVQVFTEYLDPFPTSHLLGQLLRHGNTPMNSHRALDQHCHFFSQIRLGCPTLDTGVELVQRILVCVFVPTVRKES